MFIKLYAFIGIEWRTKVTQWKKQTKKTNKKKNKIVNGFVLNVTNLSIIMDYVMPVRDDGISLLLLQGERSIL